MESLFDYVCRLEGGNNHNKRICELAQQVTQQRLRVNIVTTSFNPYLSIHLALYYFMMNTYGKRTFLNIVNGDELSLDCSRRFRKIAGINSGDNCVYHLEGKKVYYSKPVGACLSGINPSVIVLNDISTSYKIPELSLNQYWVKHIEPRIKSYTSVILLTRDNTCLKKYVKDYEEYWL